MAAPRPFSGGLASGTFLNDPGTQIVSSGGTAAGVVISGGEQDVFGSAVGTIVTAGQQFVSRGGLASGTTLGVGGTQRVASGGTANGTTIEFGGTAVIQSGGTLGAATLDGGTLVLSAGVLLNGGVSVPADGTLVIGGTAVPAHLLIGGFGAGDKIDLAAIAFDSGAGTALASGTNVLEVIESGSTYFISFGSDISADTFLLAPDGGGGTVVTLNDALAVGSGQTLTVSSGETSTGVDVLSGGEAPGLGRRHCQRGRHPWWRQRDCFRRRQRPGCHGQGRRRPRRPHGRQRRWGFCQRRRCAGR